MRVPRQPLDIPPNPTGAGSWHVQVACNGVFVQKGASVGNRSYTLGYMCATWNSQGGVGPELHLCDRLGRTFLVL